MSDVSQSSGVALAWQDRLARLEDKGAIVLYTAQREDRGGEVAKPCHCAAGNVALLDLTHGN